MSSVQDEVEHVSEQMVTMWARMHTAEGGVDSVRNALDHVFGEIADIRSHLFATQRVHSHEGGTFAPLSVQLVGPSTLQTTLTWRRSVASYRVDALVKVSVRLLVGSLVRSCVFRACVPSALCVLCVCIVCACCVCVCVSVYASFVSSVFHMRFSVADGAVCHVCVPRVCAKCYVG